MTIPFLGIVRLWHSQNSGGIPAAKAQTPTAFARAKALFSIALELVLQCKTPFGKSNLQVSASLFLYQMDIKTPCVLMIRRAPLFTLT
jgi:hypothetical protein